MTQIQAIKIGKTVNLSIDGKLHKKVCQDVEIAKQLFALVQQAKENPTEEMITKLLAFGNEKLRKALECGLEVDLDNKETYLAGFNTPLPEKLVDVIKEYHDNGYPMNPIINFWTLLMINPDKRVRENLFEFIEAHDFVLTDEGYMLVYKAVYLKDNGDQQLVEFISDKYKHVKMNWKTSPNRYTVYRTEDNALHITKKVTADTWDVKERKVTIIGNLGELFKNIDDLMGEMTFTDMYTKTMSIRLGEPVLMERHKCDGDPAKSCSYGLHVGATSYVESYANRTSAILVCLVNPMNVVAVPNHDKSKMRVTEYFPIGLADWNKEKREISIVEQSYFESDYKSHEEKDLAKMITKIKLEEKPMSTAKGATDEGRDLAELQKVIESRIINLGGLSK